MVHKFNNIIPYCLLYGWPFSHVKKPLFAEVDRVILHVYWFLVPFSIGVIVMLAEIIIYHTSWKVCLFACMCPDVFMDFGWVRFLELLGSFRKSCPLWPSWVHIQHFSLNPLSPQTVIKMFFNWFYSLEFWESCTFHYNPYQHPAFAHIHTPHTPESRTTRPSLSNTIYPSTLRLELGFYFPCNTVSKVRTQTTTFTSSGTRAVIPHWRKSAPGFVWLPYRSTQTWDGANDASDAMILVVMAHLHDYFSIYTLVFSVVEFINWLLMELC